MSSEQAESRGRPRPPESSSSSLSVGGRVQRLALVCAISLLTLNVWTGGPLLALWIGSRAQGSGPPSMAAIAVVALSLVVISLILLKALALVSDRFDRLVGRRPAAREPAPWLRSMRGERSSEHALRVGMSVPERIVALSVVVAVVAFEVWFFFLSGSPIGQSSGR